MKLWIIMLGLFATSLFAELQNAKEIRKITNKSTSEIESKLLKSDLGKEVYDGIMKLLESNILEIANGGLYDTLVITYMNSDRVGHGLLLQKLNVKEQALIRKKIIKDLENKGYKVTLNQYWDNPDSMNISISW